MRKLADFYDKRCLDLANHFLVGSIVEEARTDAQVAKDRHSLAVAIQTAVEDWFAANPIEGETETK